MTTLDSRRQTARAPRREHVDRPSRAPATPHEPAVRQWIIDRARARIDAGFYDDPLVVEAAIANAVRSHASPG